MESAALNQASRLEGGAEGEVAPSAMVAVPGVSASATVSSSVETGGMVQSEESEKAQLEKENSVSARNNLKIRVRKALSDVGGLRAKLESEIEVRGASRGERENDDEDEEVRTEERGAAKGKIRAATNVIAEVRVYIEQRKAQLGAEATAQAEARLKVADSLLALAKAKLEAGAYGEAFNLGNRAIRTAQEAKFLVQAKTEFKANINLERDGELEIEVESEHLNEAERTGGGDEEASKETKASVEINAGGGGISGEGKTELRLGF
jgi:hypothetical protein